MEHDEQRVRTMAGWIGVEISRSRVRTEGKDGYGLYRVRGSKVIERALATLGPDMKSREPTEWTAYAFTLEEIGAAVRKSIERGLPRTPEVLRLGAADDPTWVPTRWTQAYRGRRDRGEARREAFRERQSAMCHRCPLDDLGEQCWGTVRIGPDEEYGTCSRCGRESGRDFLARSIPVEVKPEFAALATAVVSLVGAGLVAMVHVEGCCCDDDRHAAACIQATAPEREVQRAQNAAFQAEHLKAREWGLRQRHAAKLARAVGQHGEQQLGPEIGSQRAE